MDKWVLTKKKKFVILSGYLLCFGYAVALFYTFISAFLTEKKQIMVNINNYNEAYVELIIMIPVSILIVAGLLILLIHYCKEYKK